MHMNPTPLPRSEDDGVMFASIGQTNLALTEPPAALHATDTLDDIFGSEEDVHGSTPLTTEPSDMRRLQSEHTTAGYREGVTVAKAASVQAGFDEGFGLGATLGLSAGEIVGVLEGLAAAVPGDERLAALLGEARLDLSARSIFGTTYWDPDGTWTYPVPGQDGGDVVFKDVVEAHPLIARWRVVLNEQLHRWGVRRDLFTEDQGVEEEVVSQKKLGNPAATAPKAAAGTAPATQSRMSDALQW
ncbi:Essential protein Yae1, N terminal [Pyricularia grisea]|uniref:Protein YAE1 n=1 Tax=Pyricularia grisea TaxID=148305 RepID=A0A6P8B8Q0_PYRGI|nr:uncharacterized protein PgNI_03931 [Pyricularia grisea]KAI6368656.1 Essential protein Yae1, N terminal [Pyricularia grisea]TLD12027.1 hypothetical protein PgNI_03931 [Pyricularia grisea]